MQIDSLKELQKLIKACRSLGVEKIEIDGIKLELGALPISKKSAKVVEPVEDFELNGIGASTPIPRPEIIPTDELTEDQLLFYSAQPQEPVAES